jgi:AbrB family looped-hinge helix DNA binding protein
MRFVKKVNERGVVTLPTEVREALGVEEGDIVEFEVLGIARKGSALRRVTPSSEPASTNAGDSA